MEWVSLNYEVTERACNFRWDIETFKKKVAENQTYFLNLEILKDQIIKFSDSIVVKNLSNAEEKVERIFSKIYRSLKISQLEYQLFCENSPPGTSVYQACLFAALSSFLHMSKRIKGKSLRDFVRANHPVISGGLKSQDCSILNFLDTETQRLRQSRYRLLMIGDVYYKKSEWNAITKDEEHEWTFYYALDDAEKVVKDTFKRIKNLYKDITTALESDKDNEYSSRVEKAYGKFLSKLKKVEYKNYLKLQEEILSHISKDKDYSGLNLYRFEKRLKPYIITNEVKRLLKCKTAEEEVDCLVKSVLLKDVCYPKVYKDFLSLPPHQMELCASEFREFLSQIVGSTCLIMDFLVENRIFGDNWEDVFRNMTNKMAENVLYNPSEIDFATRGNSQEKYLRLLNAPVSISICLESLENKLLI